MIRGIKRYSYLLLIFIVVIQSHYYQSIEITKIERTVNLAGSYPQETLKIRFITTQDQTSHFQHLVPLQYDQKISMISFVTSERDRKGLSYTRKIEIYEGVSFALYIVKLNHNINIGEEGDLFINIIYINRYVNLPSSISLTQDQKLQYEDIKYVLSPYQVNSQESIYKFAKFINSDSDGQKKGLGQVTFKAFDTKKFHHEKHTVFGVNNNPQVLFSEVLRVIEVSHWGNVAITENYKIVNTGPALNGEFSRVTYGSRNPSDIRNAFKGIDVDLPRQIWGLYYQDEVGNISTSKAYRDSDKVHVTFTPRFALLGGWKSNWQIGYNMYTDGHLYHNDNHFSLRNIQLQYALQKIVAQTYTIQIVLPYGAQNVKIKINNEQYDMSKVEKTISQGYLDFNGKPTYVIKDYKGLLKNRQIEILYDFNTSLVFQKILILFVIILILLSFAILAKRIQLQAFADKNKIE